MRMNRSSSRGWVRATLLALLAVAALLLVLAAWVAANPAVLVPVAAGAVERYLGRTLVIGGEVAIEFSGAPRIQVRDARLSNAHWSTHPQMVSAGYLMVQINLWALLERRVHLVDLDLRDAQIRLEDRVDGLPNWVFSEPADHEDPSPWTFALQGLSVDRTVVYAAIGELAPIELQVPQLRETTDPDGNLRLDGNGELNGDTWQLTGRIGTFDELMSAGRVDMRLDAVVDQVKLHAEGSIGDLASLSAVDLALALSGPNADSLGEIFGMPEAFAGDVALTATIHPMAHDHAVAIKGHVSQFAIETTGTVRDLAALDGFEGVVDLKGPDVQVFGKALQLTGVPQGPFEVAGRVRREGGDLDFDDVLVTVPGSRLVLNADFADFPRRQGAVGHLQLSGPDISRFSALLRAPHLPQAPFELDLKLDAATVGTVDATLEATFAIGEHRLSAEGPVGEFPEFEGTRLTTRVSGPEVAQLTRAAGAGEPVTGPYDARAVVSLIDGGLDVAKVAVTVGSFDVHGDAALPDIRDPERFQASGKLGTEDLAGALARLGVSSGDRAPDGALSLDVQLSGSAQGLSLERFRGNAGALDFHGAGKLGAPPDLVTGLDLSLTISAPDIQMFFDQATVESATRIPFTLSGRLQGGENAIGLTDVRLAAEGGEFQADGRVSLAPGLVGTRLAVTGQGRDLAGLVPSFPMYTPPAQPWQIGGTLEIPDARHLRVTDSHLEVGSVSIKASGTLDLEAQSGTDLDISAQGASLAEIGRIGPEGLPSVPFSLDIGLDGTPSAIQVSRLAVKWAESDLTATGSLDTSEALRLSLQGSSDVIRTEDLLMAIHGEDYGTADAVSSSDASSRVFSDDPLPLDALRAMDANVDITVGTLHDRRARLRDVVLTFDLSDGALSLSRMHFRDEIGRFDASGTLQPEGQNGRAHLQWKLTAEDADLGLFTTENQPPDTIPRYTVDISAAGAGASVSEIVGSLNGSVLVHSMAGGRIDNELVDLLAGDFVSNVLNVLNPLSGTRKFTPMNCLVLNAAIKDGNLKLAPGFVMRTDQVNMFVFGGVNLATEHLDLSLATQARRGIGISAASITNPYFKVGGTITRPSLHLDAQSAAVAASVATATAGLSIVVQGVMQRIRGHRNPCPTFRDYEREGD